MHYRWNFPQDNLEFLRYHFYHSQRDRPGRDEKTDKMMDRMRFAAQAFGVSEDAVATVESLYLAFLAALDAHLGQHPYLLGGRPCIGDFGLLAPMYAHLGRDPYPARLMQQRAVRVFRWVERMNRADQDAPEFFDATDKFLPDDAVPASLVSVLRILAEDFVPETLAAADTINQWLEENRPAPGQPAERMLGMCQFTVRGQPFTAVAQPYRFYLLQRVQALYAELQGEERQAVDDLLFDCGMKDILTANLSQSLVRSDNLEVWQAS